MSADDALLRRLKELDCKVRRLESKSRVPGWCAVLACGFLGGRGSLCFRARAVLGRRACDGGYL